MGSSRVSRATSLLRECRKRRGLYPGLWQWCKGTYLTFAEHFPKAPWPVTRPVSLRLKGSSEPVFARVRYQDVRVAEEIFGEDIYRCVPAEGLRPRSVVDLGANVGLSATYWKRLDPDARITAVEPDQGNVAALRRQIARLPGPPVEVLAAFVGGEAGTAAIDRSGGSLSYRMRSPEAGPPQGDEQTPVLSMLDLLRGRPEAVIDLLKCDIEGAEAQVFRDCAAWIGRFKYLLIEVHPPYSGEALLADLTRAGATPRVLSRTEGLYSVLFVRLHPEVDGGRS